ncbi:MAG: response regulator [Gemmatimonadota bacterium]|jgi:DNA-binding NtrC family response regulator
MSEIKLLLVDDEEDFVRTMAERLAVRDVASRVALSGEQALEMIAEDAPHVMLLDLRMPGIDGMAVLERVRREHPHVQVIVLTGHGSDDEERRARQLGAFRYLEKPAETGQLLDTIRAAWGRARALIRESREGFDRHMMAAAMAEAGVPDMALGELERRPPATSGDAGALKVLFVDDEEDFVRTIAERTRMRDLGGDVALSGEAALAALEDDLPDVMVLDLRMPGMDGLDVLRHVKRHHPRVEVIIMTGHGSAGDEAEARRIGAFEYLQKPVEFDVLMETIRAAGAEARGTEDDGDPRDGAGG